MIDKHTEVRANKPCRHWNPSGDRHGNRLRMNICFDEELFWQIAHLARKQDVTFSEAARILLRRALCIRSPRNGA